MFLRLIPMLWSCRLFVSPTGEQGCQSFEAAASSISVEGCISGEMAGEGTIRASHRSSMAPEPVEPRAPRGLPRGRRKSWSVHASPSMESVIIQLRRIPKCNPKLTHRHRTALFQRVRSFVEGCRQAMARCLSSWSSSSPRRVWRYAVQGAGAGLKGPDFGAVIMSPPIATRSSSDIADGSSQQRRSPGNG